MTASVYLALLLVDGYNMIGAWPELKTLEQEAGLESARERLIELLINYAAQHDFRTQIVFDAYARREPATETQHTAHLSTYFTGFGQTADAYIERMCAQFRQRTIAPRLIVATSDRAQQQTAMGYGAERISAPQLQRNVQQANRQQRRYHRPQQQSRGRFLFSALDPQSQQRLTQWRHGQS